MLGAPELDAVLQVGSHQSRVKGQNPLPRPAGHSSLDAAQDTVGFLGCECTLSAHAQLFIHQHLQVLLLRAALEPLSAQPVLVFGISTILGDNQGAYFPVHRSLITHALHTQLHRMLHT